MAQLFVMDSDREWVVQLLKHASYHIAPPARAAGSAPSAPTVAPDPGRRPGKAGALLLQAQVERGAANAGWLVMAAADARLRLNGEALPLGLAALRHRDELRLPGAAPLFFSDERLPVAESYAGDDAPRCPRCAQSIGRGEPAVRCPGCDVLHHQRVDRPCWTYVARCALCTQPTDASGGYRWSPEVL